MHCLIIKENMRAERSEYVALGNTSHEERLVNAHAPRHQCADHALMGRRASGGDDRGFEKTVVSGVALFSFIFESPQIAELAEEIAEKAIALSQEGAEEKVDSESLFDLEEDDDLGLDDLN